MNMHSDKPAANHQLRQKLLGLGATSLRKNYYPELQKRMQEIEEAEQRYRAIVQASPMGMYLYELNDKDDLILIDSNPAADRFTGIDNQQMLGKTLEQAFPSLTGTEIPDIYKNVAITGTTWQTTNLTYQDNHINGTYDVHVFQTSPRRIAVVFLDITEKRCMEEQLRQGQKMESIGRLAGGIAHDFNNMLAGIMGAAELLGNKLKGDEKLNRYVHLIRDAAAKAANLTNQLLSFSRKGNLAAAPIDFHDITQAAVELLKRSIDPRIEINCQLDAEKSIISGDGSQLQNVILNLGVNAADAMPEGGKITITTENVVLATAYCAASPFELSPGSFLRLTVADTGVGMDHAVMTKIFEPFFTTKEHGKGTGLGLSAVYGAIKNHQGAITVYSEPGTGTVFHSYLPLLNATSIQSENTDSKFIKGSGCILVIDDEAVVRDMAKGLLEELGYTVLLAEDGMDGLNVYRRNHGIIDLVILDMTMPKMNGIDCFRALRSINPQVEVVISSGFACKTEIDQLRTEGIKGFIKKPYQQAELSQLLAEALPNMDDAV